MYAAEQKGGELGEDEVAECARSVVAACADRDGSVIFVTNEVGLGVVPDNALARRYRDVLGRCNQVVAGAADKVVFMVSGVAMQVKG